VIGPSSLPYHRTCLTCIACNKRLDSTLLLEHEGQPFCKNCHRAHLGTGKGGFSVAVPLNPTIPNNSFSPSRTATASMANTTSGPISPTSYRTTPTSHSSKPSWSKSNANEDRERGSLDLQEEVPVIRVTGRGGSNGADGVSGVASSSMTSTRNQPLTPPSKTSGLSLDSRDHTISQNVRSLDEAVSGGRSSESVTAPTETEEKFNGNANGNGKRNGNGTHLEEEVVEEEDLGWDESIRESEREKRRLEKERLSLYSRPENNSGNPKSLKAGSNEYRQSLGSNASHNPISFPSSTTSSSNPCSPSSSNSSYPPPSSHASTSTSATIGRVSAGGGLPEPKRANLKGANHTAKISSPAPLSHAPVYGVSADQITSGIGKLGLGSSIAAAAGGTPLCARCEKAVCEYYSVLRSLLFKTLSALCPSLCLNLISRKEGRRDYHLP